MKVKLLPWYNAGSAQHDDGVEFYSSSFGAWEDCLRQRHKLAMDRISPRTIVRMASEVTLRLIESLNHSSSFSPSPLISSRLITSHIILIPSHLIYLSISQSLNPRASYALKLLSSLDTFRLRRAMTRVVERAVLPWNHGRTGGSTNFSGRHEHYLWKLLIVFCFHLPWDRLPGPQMNPESRGFIPVGPRGGPG